MSPALQGLARLVGYAREMDTELQSLVTTCLSTLDALVSDYESRPTFFKETVGFESGIDDTESDEAATGLVTGLFAFVLDEELFDQGRGSQEILSLLTALGERYGNPAPGLTTEELEDVDEAHETADLYGWEEDISGSIMRQEAPGLLEPDGLERMKEILRYYSA